MPTKVRLSPGVYVNEFDFSSYAQALGLTTLCIVGAASKGPLNVPTMCVTETDLINNFGAPLLTDYGLQAAVQVLRGGGQVLYSRVAHAGNITATIAVPGTSGGTPAVVSGGTITFTGQPADADYIRVRKTTPLVTLENDVAGSAGNTTLSTTGTNIIVAGMAGGIGQIKATGSIQFKNSTNPTTGDTVSLDDGSGVSQPVIFEFTNTTPGGGHTAVAIGVDAYATAQNLVNQINTIIGGLRITATNATIEKIFEFDNNASYVAGRVAVQIGATSSITMSNLITAIRNNAALLSLSVQDTSSNNPQATLSSLLGGLLYNAPLAKSSGGSSGNITLVGLTGGTNAVAGSTVTGFTVTAASPGTWGKDLSVEVVSPSQILGATNDDFDLIVVGPLDNQGTLGAVEKFTRVNLTVGDPRSVDQVTSQGILGEVGPSKLIVTEIIVSAADATSGVYGLVAAGSDSDVNGLALVASDYIGTVTGQVSTGLKAVNNPESTEFNLIAVPGCSNASVINEIIATCNARGDCFGLIDPPFGLDVDAVIDWHNGLSFIVANAPTQALDSNRVALYWAWQQAYDSYNAQSIWLPPSGFVAAAMATSDAANGPWAAVAGLNRGRLPNSLACEYSPYQADRDKLQGGANHVNPIVNFSNVGPTIYGNRTLQRAQTALDSVHTRRMLTYLEKVITTAVGYIVFDPNDPVTWSKFIQIVTPILDTVKAGRGLQDYRVICDKTTNPDTQIRRKTMKGKILIKALDVAEIIEQDFALFATGAEFNENF